MQRPLLPSTSNSTPAVRRGGVFAPGLSVCGCDVGLVSSEELEGFDTHRCGRLRVECDGIATFCRPPFELPKLAGVPGGFATELAGSLS